MTNDTSTTNRHCEQWESVKEGRYYTACHPMTHRDGIGVTGAGVGVTAGGVRVLVSHELALELLEPVLVLALALE